MIHVEKIKIVKNTYPSNILKKDLEINCSSINLFVGEQGCGKSTLLQLLQKNHEDIELSLSDFVIKEGVDTFYFDTEKDNPRIKDPNLFTTPSGKDVGIGYGGALTSRFRSHGEVLQDFIIAPLLKAKNSVIFLDEPESGLSITNQYKLIQAIKKASENGCQLFIATHCFPLIQEFDVFSLQHNKQMNGKDFIEEVSQFKL